MYLKCQMLVFFFMALTWSGDEAQVKERQPDQAPTSKGAKFFLVGGGASKKHALATFVKLAGGNKANIAILPHAAYDPEHEGPDMESEFHALGAGQTSVILPGSQVGLPSGATAVWLTGGDQNRLLLKIKLQPKLLNDLKNFAGIIGGTSAGAMVETEEVILGGMNDGVVAAGELCLQKVGLGYLSRVVFDTHLAQYPRDARSFDVLAEKPDVLLAVGLDPDTGVYIEGRRATVYGPGYARLYKRGSNFASDVSEQKRGSVASVENVLVSYIGESKHFDLPETKLPSK